MPAAIVQTTENDDASGPMTASMTAASPREAAESSVDTGEMEMSAPLRPRSRRPASEPAVNGHANGNGHTNGNGAMPQQYKTAALPERESERMQRSITEIHDAVQRILRIQAVLTGEIRAAADSTERHATNFLAAAQENIAETRTLGTEVKTAAESLRGITPVTTPAATSSGPAPSLMPETALLLAEKNEEMRQTVAQITEHIQEQSELLRRLAEAAESAPAPLPAPTLDTSEITAPLNSLVQSTERMNAQQASQHQATTISLHRISTGSERIERQVVEMHDRIQHLHNEAHGEITEALEELKANLVDVEREIVQTPQRQKQIIEEAFAMDLRRLQARVEETAEISGVQAQKFTAEVRDGLKKTETAVTATITQEFASGNSRMLNQTSQIGSRLDTLTKEVRTAENVVRQQGRIHTILLLLAVFFTGASAIGILLFHR